MTDQAACFKWQSVFTATKRTQNTKHFISNRQNQSQMNIYDIPQITHYHPSLKVSLVKKRAKRPMIVQQEPVHLKAPG